jgi:hypothetical protein
LEAFLKCDAAIPFGKENPNPADPARNTRVPTRMLKNAYEVRPDSSATRAIIADGLAP